MRNNNLKFTDTTLVVEPLGLDKIWSLKGSIDTPGNMCAEPRTTRA